MPTSTHSSSWVSSVSISVSAVGSLQEQIAPLHMVVPDQLIDRTRLRKNTFFGDGLDSAHLLR